MVDARPLSLGFDASAATRLRMLVVLSGPTASGKSSLALSVALEGPLAQQIEIISMDSAQWHRGLEKSRGGSRRCRGA
ncbi:MAG: hypothetical protein EBX54_08760, partial [Betaproteobacteria bacterium]|nr:hypothetical protein [Betaproteobacteria bacterium]